MTLYSTVARMSRLLNFLGMTLGTYVVWYLGAAVGLHAVVFDSAP